MSIWQTMETAPKDGTSVLAILKDSTIPYTVFFQNGGWAMTWDGYRLDATWDGPIHWMPLPPHPANP